MTVWHPPICPPKAARPTAHLRELICEPPDITRWPNCSGSCQSPQGWSLSIARLWSALRLRRSHSTTVSRSRKRFGGSGRHGGEQVRRTDSRRLMFLDESGVTPVHLFSVYCLPTQHLKRAGPGSLEETTVWGARALGT